MKHISLTFAALLFLPSLPAQAGKIGLPSSMPAVYKSECGSCHAPFPPALLSATAWKQTMSGLEQHFGTDASLDDKSAEVISAWLQRNAGRGMDAGGREPRLTATAWFIRKHDEVPARIWKDERIKSAANCAACHPGADNGRYGERELNVPGMGRWEDD